MQAKAENWMERLRLMWQIKEFVEKYGTDPEKIPDYRVYARTPGSWFVAGEVKKCSSFSVHCKC